MKKLFLAFILIFFWTVANAQETYIYKDKKGITTVTNVKPADDVVIQDRSSYTRSDPREIEKYRKQRQAEIETEERIAAQTRKTNEDAEAHKRKSQEIDVQKSQKQNENENIYCFTSIIGGSVVGGSMVGGSVWRICRDKKTKALISKERL